MARKRVKPKTTTQRERILAKLVLSKVILDNVIELPNAENYLPTLEFLKTEVGNAIIHFRLIPDIYGRPPTQINKNIDRILDNVYDIKNEVAFEERANESLHSPELYLIMVFEVMMVDILESVKNPINKEMVQALADSAIIMSTAMDPKCKATETYEEALRFVKKIYEKMRETWI